MNELTDDEIRAALDTAGRGPTDESRLRIRAALIGGAPLVSRPEDRRRTGWLVGGALLGAAALVGAVVFVNRDDATRVSVGSPVDSTGASSDTAGDSSAPSSSEAASASAAGSPFDVIAGRTRWILDSVDGAPWTGAIVPFIDPTISGTSFLADGSDGCNLLDLIGDVVDDRIELSETMSTKVVCDDVAAAGPRSDEAFELDATGRLVSTDGRLAYRPVDSGDPVGWGDLLGTWKLEGWDPPVAVTPGSVAIGPCALTPTDPARVELEGWPPFSAGCFGEGRPRSVALLAQILSSGTGRGFLEKGTLVLVGEEATVQLERVDVTADPDAISIEAGAAFGLVPGTEVSVDSERERIEGILGPVSHDTGWYDVPLVTYEDGTQDCLGGKEYRVLWWGDLSLSFYRGTDGPEWLWAWSVGDRRVTLRGDRREPYDPEALPRSSLRTETGIGILTPEAELLAAYEGRLTKLDRPPDELGGQVYESSRHGWPLSPNEGTVMAAFLVRDGVVTGFGAHLQFCGFRW